MSRWQQALPWTLLVIAVGYLVWSKTTSSDSQVNAEQGNNLTESNETSTEHDTDFHIPRPIIDNKPEEPADALLDPELPIPQKLVVLERILIDYQTSHHELPTGSQTEIMDALTGNNPRGIAYISPDHPVTELEDYFFHVLGRNSIEIRHWGDDTIHFSDDDIVSKPHSSVETKL